MKVAVRNLAMSAEIEINPGEIGRRQPLVVHIILSLARILADKIGATIDYREIERGAEAVAARRIALIETFSTFLAEALLRDPRVCTTAVVVSKSAGLDRGIASAQINLRRASHPRDSSPPDGTGR